MAHGMRAIARLVLANVRVRIEGAEHVPERGPALLVCRHYHHLYDGAVLVSAVKRPVRVVAGLDWVRGAPLRGMMEALCAAAGWPIVLRRGAPAGNGGGFDAGERRRYARTALLRSTELFRNGEVLAMFPQGYPIVDPHATVTPADWLPFAEGYLTIAERARRSGVAVPLIPTGFVYGGARERPARITVRFGAPEALGATRDRRHVADRLEARMRALCV